MNQSIEKMMNEHRLIEQVLGALGTFAEALQDDPSLPRADVAKFARFFQQFADKCHHGKEEDRLFVKMNECGFPTEYGPIGVMLADHNEGRGHVRVLAAIGAASGPLTEHEVEQVIEHAEAFLPLLAGHIQKEDNVLYPMAQQSIPPAEFAKLDANCEAFDREVMGADAVEQLKALARELIAKYPPCAERLAAAAACGGCSGHR
ncbi:MAG: hemerythrin [Verrucomicrobia bacterium]|nr:hemerythrin [Verrucomicrobiota bacterium]